MSLVALREKNVVNRGSGNNFFFRPIDDSTIRFIFVFFFLDTRKAMSEENIHPDIHKTFDSCSREYFFFFSWNNALKITIQSLNVIKKWNKSREQLSRVLHRNVFAIYLFYFTTVSSSSRKSMFRDSLRNIARKIPAIFDPCDLKDPICTINIMYK